MCKDSGKKKPKQMPQSEISARSLIPWGLDPYIFHSQNYVVVDFETTNINFGECRDSGNHIVTASWIEVKDGEVGEMQSCYADEYHQERLAKAIEEADFFVAHNAKFEYGWLSRMGVDISQELAFCTMIAEYVLQGNVRKPGSLKLNNIAKALFGEQKENLVGILIRGGVCPSEIPRRFLIEYCEQDVHLTHKVFQSQLQEITDAELLPVMYTRAIVTPVLVDIESRGMHLDYDRVLQENIKYEREFADISRQISEFTGGTNLNSPKQVAELLYERLGFNELKDRRGNPLRTAANGRLTDAASVATLKATNKKQRRFLELFAERGRLNAALTKNLRFFRGICEEKDGIFYASYNQTVTQTHRLSSSGVKVALDIFDGKEKGIQLQNSPRIFKRLYSPRTDGWLLGEIDGAQLEFRVAAFLGADERARSDIEDGVDVHQFTATTLTEAGEETTRQEAKSRTFKPLYGGYSGTDAERAYFDEFKKKYHGVAEAQQRWIDEVLTYKQLRTVTGLIFYWPDTKVTRSGYVTNTTSICNFPVQMFATADIIPVALTINYYYLKRELLESFIVNTIHDSVIGEVAPGEEEEYSEIGRWSFNEGVLEYLKEVYSIDFDVPLDSECKLGHHWGDSS